MRIKESLSSKTIDPTIEEKEALTPVENVLKIAAIISLVAAAAFIALAIWSNTPLAIIASYLGAATSAYIAHETYTVYVELHSFLNPPCSMPGTHADNLGKRLTERTPVIRCLFSHYIAD